MPRNSIFRAPHATAAQPAKRNGSRAGLGELAAKRSPDDDSALRPAPGTPWFTAIRSDDALELVRASRNAFILAYVIAFRARWKDGFNRHGLDQGEAMLGDFQACGLTRQEYRTSKEQLTKWGFATFKTTNKGTVAKLMDTRLFSLVPPERNQQNNQPLTIKQPSNNHQTTTTGTKEERSKTVKTGRNAVVENSFIPGQPANP